MTSPAAARAAAIDVGSNALRLLVAEPEEGGGYRAIAEERTALRLGPGVFTESEEMRLVHMSVCRRMPLGGGSWAIVELGGGSAEILFPVLDPRLVRYIHDEVLEVCLSDNVKARRMDADGGYKRPSPGGARVDSQAEFLARRGAGRRTR